GRVIDTVFSIAGTTDKLIIAGPGFGFDPEAFAQMTFGGDSAFWSWSTVVSRYYAQNQTSGNDNFVGFETDETINMGAGDDYLDGGPGRDILIGGIGNDTYGFAPITDTKIIRDNGNVGDVDTLAFLGSVLPGDVSIFRSANENDVLVLINTSG